MWLNRIHKLSQYSWLTFCWDSVAAWCQYDATDSPSPECTSSANDTKTKVPRATMPTWLADEYADARTRLDSEIAKTGRPVCYESGQFMITAPPLVFSRVVPFEIEPLDFYRPRFSIWLSHLF
ncbi:uncharacterized protein HD556DRAFT_1360932 [Suillus plorans]|uniref:Uncharacterized protein n=1 Tax=Suillus plorans TaxID=116603 RepID=A0A9P7AXW9_9AGAM|nr:uncharacterized protein HD556DRAFT_1360932 [Suillus plorans]KAG1796365.1 hypothetical protein HD556DRAFT_1360932 [Suillus plorans]